MNNTPVWEAMAPPMQNNIRQDWLEEIRSAAATRFSEMDWPDLRTEDWRRSGIQDYNLESFNRVEPDASIQPVKPIHSSYYSQSFRLEDGQVTLYSPAGNDEGIQSYALHLSGEWDNMPEELRRKVRNILLSGVSGLDHKFAAWHYSLLSEIFVIQAEPGFRSELPLLIEIVESGRTRLSAPHIIILAGRGAELKVDVINRTATSAPVLQLGAVTLHAEPQSRVVFSQSQFFNKKSFLFQDNALAAGENTEIDYRENHLGTQYTRVKTSLSLSGRGARAELKGIMYAGKNQKMDIHTLQDHLSPDAYSRAYYKGVSRDNGVSQFQGLIRVEPGAVRTDAYLTNKNLLLNDGARAFSMPELKIMNNDVKCSHGSTTGRISPDQMYYLMARGFSRREATRLLTVAFYNELLNDCTPLVRDRILKSVEKDLGTLKGFKKWRSG